MSFGIYGALGTWGGAPVGGDVTLDIEAGSFTVNGQPLALSVESFIDVSSRQFNVTGFDLDLVYTKGPGPQFDDVTVGYAEDGFSVDYAIDEITVNYG